MFVVVPYPRVQVLRINNSLGDVRTSFNLTRNSQLTGNNPISKQTFQPLRLQRGAIERVLSAALVGFPSDKMRTSSSVYPDRTSLLIDLDLDPPRVAIRLLKLCAVPINVIFSSKTDGK